MLDTEVVTMFPQIPAKLPAAITKSRDLTEFIMSKHMERYSFDGPVALAWRWALTGEGPTPITLTDWHKGPPIRQDIDWQMDCPDEWRGRVPWDEVRAARGVLWWLTSAPDDEVPFDLRPSSRLPQPMDRSRLQCPGVQDDETFASSVDQPLRSRRHGDWSGASLPRGRHRPTLTFMR